MSWDEGYLGVIRDRIRGFDEVYASGCHIPWSDQARRCMIVGDYVPENCASAD